MQHKPEGSGCGSLCAPTPCVPSSFIIVLPPCHLSFPLVVVVVMPPPRHLWYLSSICHHSTHHPPHKQLLMKLGAGGVSFVVMGGAGWLGVGHPGHHSPVHQGPPFVVVVMPHSQSQFPSTLSSAPVPHPVYCHHHCHHPCPCSQLSSSFHPPSTPWAVACEAGGGWCVIHHCGWCSCPHHSWSVLSPQSFPSMYQPSTLQVVAHSGSVRRQVSLSTSLLLMH